MKITSHWPDWYLPGWFFIPEIKLIIWGNQFQLLKLNKSQSKRKLCSKDSEIQSCLCAIQFSFILISYATIKNRKTIYFLVYWYWLLAVNNVQGKWFTTILFQDTLSFWRSLIEKKYLHKLCSIYKVTSETLSPQAIR